MTYEVSTKASANSLFSGQIEINILGEVPRSAEVKRTQGTFSISDLISSLEIIRPIRKLNLVPVCRP